MLTMHFDMKDLDDAFFVLGIKIHHDRSPGIHGLYQKRYIKRILNRFSMGSCKPCKAPIQKGERRHNT